MGTVYRALHPHLQREVAVKAIKFISRRIDSVLRKMVSKSPDNRPSAAEVAAALAPQRHTLRNTVLTVLFVAVICATTYIIARRDDGAEKFRRGVV